MNTLSWLIYAAAVSESLCLFIGIGLFGVSLFGLFELMAGKMEGKPLVAASGRNKLVVCACVAAIASFIPGKSSLYMIAGSEIGERVASQPEAKEMLGDMREFLAKQIKKLRDEK